MSRGRPLHGFGGSGGAALNFKVIAYADQAALQAATPAENTIGVITTKEISTRVFSGEQPQNLPEGALWIKTGSESQVSFNALKTKKDAVIICPLSAKQVVDGVLTEVTCKSFRNGEWVDWILYLDISLEKWSRTSSRGALSFSNNMLVYTFPASNGTWVSDVLKYSDLIDFSGRSTLEIIGTGEIVSQGSTLACTLVLTDGTTELLAAELSSFSGSASVDISGISGSLYLQIKSTVGSYSSCSLEITGIALR